MKDSREEFSVKGFTIRWNRQLGLSEVQKQKIKTDLRGMFEEISKAMNCAKEEGTRDEVAEMRLPLPSHVHLHAYLAVEYCNDAWHLFLETYANCIGELVRKNGPFIQTLKDSDVEEETL